MSNDKNVYEFIWNIPLNKDWLVLCPSMYGIFFFFFTYTVVIVKRKSDLNKLYWETLGIDFRQ